MRGRAIDRRALPLGPRGQTKPCAIRLIPTRFLAKNKEQTDRGHPGKRACGSFACRPGSFLRSPSARSFLLWSYDYDTIRRKKYAGKLAYIAASERPCAGCHNGTTGYVRQVQDRLNSLLYHMQILQPLACMQILEALPDHHVTSLDVHPHPTFVCTRSNLSPTRQSNLRSNISIPILFLCKYHKYFIKIV